MTVLSWKLKKARLRRAMLFMRKKGEGFTIAFLHGPLSRSEREEDVRKYSRFPGRADGLIVLG
jgi:hypothetical protein